MGGHELGLVRDGGTEVPQLVIAELGEALFEEDDGGVEVGLGEDGFVRERLELAKAALRASAEASGNRKRKGWGADLL